MLGSSNLRRNIATLHISCPSLRLLLLLARIDRDPVLHDHAVADFLLPVVEVPHIFVHIVLLTQLCSQRHPHVITPVRAKRLRILVRCLHFMHSAALLTKAIKRKRVSTASCTNQFIYLRLDSFVFIVHQFAPLIEPVKFQLAPVTTSCLLEEVALGPLVLHALIPGNRVVLFLWRDSFHAIVAIAVACQVGFAERLRIRLVLCRLRTLCCLGRGCYDPIEVLRPTSAIARISCILLQQKI